MDSLHCENRKMQKYDDEPTLSHRIESNKPIELIAFHFLARTEEAVRETLKKNDLIAALCRVGCYRMVNIVMNDEINDNQVISMLQCNAM